MVLMAAKILSIGYWVLGGAILAGSARTGGWGWVVPACTAAALVVIGVDLYRHRETVTLDLEMVRTLLYLVSTIVVGSAVLVALVNFLLTGRLGF